MIAKDYITEWRAHAPWVTDAQVEQDLVISRALVEILHEEGRPSGDARAIRKEHRGQAARPRIYR